MATSIYLAAWFRVSITKAFRKADPEVATAAGPAAAYVAMQLRRQRQ
jgi:hypothetical protein